MQFFDNNLLELRPVEPGDIDLLYRWENDTTQWRDSATVGPYSRKLLADYVDSYQANIYIDGQLRLMVDEAVTKQCVGIVDLYDFDARNHRAGVGIYIAAADRCKGYAKIALELLAAYARHHIGMHQLWAVVGMDNSPARRLFESAGYDACGRLRSWIRSGSSYADALMFQLLFP